MAQRFAVVGLGRFGARLAANLTAAGAEVIAVDRDPEVIEAVRDTVTLAVALDATDEQALRMHGIHEVDVAVVGIGTSLEPIVLTTLVLKQVGVKRVIARTITRAGGVILRRIGAEDIVAPEDESADRWANQLINPHFATHFGLDREHSIVEVRTPAAWVGRSLAELRLRQQRGLHVVAVKRRLRPGDEPRVFMPDPVTPLTTDEWLVLMGADRDLAKLRDDR